MIATSNQEAAHPIAVRFTTHRGLDRRLQGQDLEERHQGRLTPVPITPEASILAADDNGALWTISGAGAGVRYEVAAGPDDIASGEALRDQLKAGRFLGLLPIVHLLREIEQPVQWTPPPLRAAIVFDDPNLRAMSYGFLRFEELVRHARAHRYHAVIASIPLDYGAVRTAAATLFREHVAQLSLALHGNNHEAFEFLRVDSEEEALRIVAQSLRRAADFERRTGLAISRVVCAPHEVCASTVLRALLRLDVDAVCLETPLQRRPGIPRLQSLLNGWEPAQFIETGIPLLPRYPLSYSFDDIVLRAFLDQPLIVFGHHTAVADGFGRLEKMAARINGLGDVTWASLAAIALANFQWRRVGTEFIVRPYARRIQVAVPQGTERLTVEIPPLDSGEGSWQLAAGHSRASVTTPADQITSVSFEGPFSSSELIELHHPQEVSPQDVPPPRQRAWPVVRRILTESRDRMMPLRRRQPGVALD